ncbi:hypothetical protein M8C21_033453, partial [Ambrosia artemisiifolia]
MFNTLRAPKSYRQALGEAYATVNLKILLLSIPNANGLCDIIHCCQFRSLLPPSPVPASGKL